MKSYFKILFFIIFFAFIAIDSYSQTRRELERRREENIKNLEYSRELLEKTKERKEYSLNQLSILQKGINYREGIIRSLRNEIDLMDREIDLLNEKIENNENEIDILKQEYARIIRKSYRNIDDEYSLMYILGSRDMNQTYQRIKYIRYLNDYRKQTITRLQELNDTIIRQIQQKDSLINENEHRINQLEKEQNDLNKDRKDKNSLVFQLRKEEKKLLDEIAERERATNRIENEIRELIEEEARKARESNRINALTPEQQIISEEFVENKGRLPWPTEKGIITSQFGTNNHPVLSGVTINNIGIDITTNPGSYVRSVFKGKVTKVIAILGSNFTVIIEHGKYRTVYQNVVNLRVKTGDIVETNQYIGTVSSDDSDVAKVHFMIWEDMDTVDPELWLSK